MPLLPLDCDMMTRVPNHAHDREGAAAFHRLRIALGVLGVALPFLLAAAGYAVDGRLQPTISDYFHTTQRDLLVGGLCAIGIFLAFHRGFRRYPGRWVSPDLIALIAGLAAMGVAFFPNESDTVATLSQRVLGLTLAPVFHYASALLLYLMMSLTCFLVYAPQTEGWERRFHIWAGRVIFASGVMVMVLSAIKNNAPDPFGPFVGDHNLVFWDESIGVWAFSLAWLLRAWRCGAAQGMGQRITAHRPVPPVFFGRVGPPHHPGAGGIARLIRPIFARVRLPRTASPSGLNTAHQPPTTSPLTTQRRHARTTARSTSLTTKAHPHRYRA